MLFLGDKAIGDMSELPQLVGAMMSSSTLPTLVGLGATPAELEEALALLKKLAAVTAERAGSWVTVANVSDVYNVKDKLYFPGEVFVAVNAALALAQRVPLSQDGQGRVGTGSQVAAKLQEGIAALLPLVDVARAGAAPSRKMSTGAKVAIGVGVAAVLGLGIWAARRR